MSQLKLHCPKCKSTNITITTESSVTGGLTTHHGGISSTHLSNNHQNFWICSDCGSKFRNIQNLEEEIQKNRNSSTVLLVLGVLCAVLTGWLYMKISSSTLGGLLLGPFALGAALGTIIFIIGSLVEKKKQQKRKKELEYLKENCFN